jgi:uncharacterized protein (DUF302 family)
MRCAILALAMIMAFAASAASAGELTRVPSKFGVKETIDRLLTALDARGLKVAARVDHGAAAKAAGMEMPPAEVVMFGNPKLGTPLMLSNPEVAFDLPMKIAVWQEKDGKVWLGYLSPDLLKARHALTGVEEQLKTMTGALAGLAKAATE